jgi:uncharacterized protein
MSAEEEISDYPVLARMQEEGECAFLSPVKLQLAVTREYDHFRVSGSVEVAVRLGCSRCLASFETGVRSAFTIFYSRQVAGGLDEDEVELAEQDLVTATFSGDEIDLFTEMQEQVVMELPFKPLCHEECRGLCSRCGADLNQGDCGCERNATGFSFSALKDFKAAK